MLSDSAIIVRGFLPVAWEVVALDADYEPNKKGEEESYGRGSILSVLSKLSLTRVMARDGKANGNSTSHELNKSLTMTSTTGF